eukprot:11090034-Heterocapsa_arctica.AAC.1
MPIPTAPVVGSRLSQPRGDRKHWAPPSQISHFRPNRGSGHRQRHHRRDRLGQLRSILVRKGHA